jgi:RimJ/RimL family protein N-acetyltransferase
MNLTLGDFELAHFSRVVCRDAPNDVFSGYVGMDFPALSRTLYLEGVPVAMAGLLPRHPGVARVWTWVSEEAGNHMLSFTKIARELLRVAFDELEFKRIDAEIDCESERNIRWAEMLGFEREARMKNYGLYGKGDYYLYRILSDG